MPAPYKCLKIENSEKLRKIILSNPKRKNALSLHAYRELTGDLKKFVNSLRFCHLTQLFV